MKSLEIKLQELGFSDDYIKAVSETIQYDSASSPIPDISFQDFEQEIISSTELEITVSPSSDTNYIIGDIDNEDSSITF